MIENLNLNITSWQYRNRGALWKDSRHDTVLGAQLFCLVRLLWGVPPGDGQSLGNSGKRSKLKQFWTWDYCSPQSGLVSCTPLTWGDFNQHHRQWQSLSKMASSPSQKYYVVHVIFFTNLANLRCSSMSFGVTQITCCPFQYFTKFKLWTKWW